MRICRLTIATTVDGRETTIRRMGKIQIADEESVLIYEEESAQVRILLRKKSAVVERKGDYSLSLHLIEGVRNVATMFIAGSTGEIPVETYKVDRIREGNFLTVELCYRLFFGEESQDMRIRINAEWRP